MSNNISIESDIKMLLSHYVYTIDVTYKVEHLLMSC